MSDNEQGKSQLANQTVINTEHTDKKRLKKTHQADEDELKSKEVLEREIAELEAKLNPKKPKKKSRKRDQKRAEKEADANQEPENEPKLDDRPKKKKGTNNMSDAEIT
jgi:hypothetical protein